MHKINLVLSLITACVLPLSMTFADAPIMCAPFAISNMQYNKKTAELIRENCTPLNKASVSGDITSQQLQTNTLNINMNLLNAYANKKFPTYPTALKTPPLGWPASSDKAINPTPAPTPQLQSSPAPRQQNDSNSRPNTYKTTNKAKNNTHAIKWY